MKRKKDSLGRRRSVGQDAGSRGLPRQTNGALTGKDPPVPFEVQTDDVALAWWQGAVADMRKMGILEASDWRQLGLGAQSYSDMLRARQEFREGGVTIMNAKGCIVQNPAGIAQRQAMQQYQACLSHLGLTPAARAKLSPREEEDPLAALAKAMSDDEDSEEP